MRLAKVFQNGRSQAVRIPKEYRVDTDEVYIEHIGHSIILSPKEKSKWAVMRNALEDMEDFLPDTTQPEVQERAVLIYMLDTNIISYIIKNRNYSLIDKRELEAYFRFRELS
nr:type II toxin-antitoxin system VapB family antitoxin [Sulfurimonas sp. SAG-AH-194-C21]